MGKQPSRARAPASEAGPDQIDVEVGVNLRRIRLTRGLSQTELADALGISFQQVQKYERGVNRVSASMLVKSARFLGVAPADLLPPEDRGAAAPNFIRGLSEVPGALEAVNAYCALPDRALRRAVLDFMRAMAPKAASKAKAVEDGLEHPVR